MDKTLFLKEADRMAALSPNTALSRDKASNTKEYVYKKAAPVMGTKPKRDEAGFIAPYAMFRPIREPGLLCELLGDNPVRRCADLKMNLDFLMKEAYEHMIEQMMCSTRLNEIRCQMNMCKEDRAMEHYARMTEKGVSVDAPKVTTQEQRKAILDAVTWKYEWIQQNKKRCFRFAEVIIARQENGGTKNLQESRFVEDFIQYAAALPEPNRRVLDMMYEAAWQIICIYRFGMTRDQVPEPWYDTVSEVRKNGKEHADGKC